MSTRDREVALGSITTWLSGGTPQRTNEAYWGGSIPWISAQSLTSARVGDSAQRITSAGLQAGSKLAPTGATLVLVRGMALHRETRIGLAMRPLSFNQDVKALIPRRGVWPEFLLYALQARSRQILNLVSSAGSGTGVLDTGRLKRLMVWLPDLAEQQAIAETLEDVDSAISTLDRLITKKEAIKQGLMQQLLSGRTRLPGFSDDWEETRLDHLAAVVGGGTPSSTVAEYWGGEVPWCTPTDITAEASRYLTNPERSITKQGLAASAATLLPAGALLLCTRATIGEVKIARVATATNQGFKSLVPHAGVCGEFLYFLVLTLKGSLASLGTGSTFLEVSKRDVASLDVRVPSLEEQRAIAAVLTDVDDEVMALRARLRKAQDVRQGMLQQLLTGRMRLPVREEVAA